MIWRIVVLASLIAGCARPAPLPLDLERSRDNLGAPPKLADGIDSVERICREGSPVRAGTCNVERESFVWFIQPGRRQAYRVSDGMLVFVESAQKGPDTRCLGLRFGGAGPARYGEIPQCVPSITVPCKEMRVLPELIRRD